MYNVIYNVHLRHWYNDGGCDGYDDYRSIYKNEKYIFNEIVFLQQIEIVYIYIYIYILQYQT